MTHGRLSRRQWMGLAALGGSAPWLIDFAQPVTAWQSLGTPAPVAPGARDMDDVARRASRLIRAFEAQGYHRTATTVDAQSGDWLAEQIRQIGLTPRLEPFAVERIDLATSELIVSEPADGQSRRIEGIPLFDGEFTDERGVAGRLGPLGSPTEIGLTDTAVNAAGRGALGEARRSGRHKAIVAVTRARRGVGLCPSNADDFRTPFGPPVLQVSNEHEAWLREKAARGSQVRVVAHVARSSTSANNVTAVLGGTDPSLAPFIVMTPRSGWYWCASERGGGLASWLEIMRVLRPLALPRSVLFVASSGHELGHLGIDAFIERRPDIATSAAGWLHLGANIGAAIDPGITLQASHDDLDAALTQALSAVGLEVTQRNPRDRIPSGEAEAVHRRGGRYVSMIGGNGVFHHLDDRGPTVVNPTAIAKCAAAFTTLVHQEARNQAR